MNNLDQYLLSDNTDIPTIIGYIGAKQSGKSFQSERLIQQGFQKVDFADKLRELSWGIFGWKPKNKDEYELFKLGKVYIEGFGFVNGRKFLQNVGENINLMDKTFWCRQWKKDVDKLIIKGYTNIVVSDIRHLTEIDALKSYLNKAKVKVYFCDYNSENRDDSDNHESERLAKYFKNLGYKHLQEVNIESILIEGL